MLISRAVGGWKPVVNLERLERPCQGPVHSPRLRKPFKTGEKEETTIIAAFPFFLSFFPEFQGGAKLLLTTNPKNQHRPSGQNRPFSPPFSVSRTSIID